MRKLFTSMALLLCASVSSVSAGDIYSVELGSAPSSDYFSVVETTDGTTTNYNGKYTGTYNGTSYTAGLKLQGGTQVQFTTTAASTITVVQSIADSKTNSSTNNIPALDGTAMTSYTDDSDNKVRVWTKTDVEAGAHYISRANKELGLLYVSVEYTGAVLTTLSAPTLTPNTANGEVTISYPENASSVVYTTDGSTPSADNGTTITAEKTITVDDGATVNAIAIGDQTTYANSAVATTTVYIDNVTIAAPVISSSNGVVAITDATPGTTIYYTKDGGTPTTSSTAYIGTFYLAEDATVKAIAVREGSDNSEEASAEVEGVAVATGVAINGASTGWENKNSVTLTVDELTYTLAITGNSSKSFNSQGKVNGATGIKLSNKAQNTLTLPDGYVATKITFYSFVNGSTETASGWSEVGGTSYSDYEDFPMAATSGSYDIRTYELNKLNKITFTNAGTQLIFTIALDIEKEAAETVTASIAAGGYRGFSSAKAVEVPDDVTIYVVNKGGVDLVNYTFEITPIESKIIPANTGVILKGAANTDYTLTVTEEEATASDYANNILVATSVEDNCTIDQTSYDYYAIAKAQFKFLKYVGTDNFNANLSYIRLDAGATNGAKEFNIIENTTGISSVKAAENGNATLYNLAGQKVSSNYSGIVVKNGKKFMVK